MSRYGDAALALGLTAVMAWLMMQTLALGAAARFVPQVTIAVTLAILVAESVRELSRAMRAPDRGPSGDGLRLRELRAVGWIGASFCLIALLGAAGGTALVLAAYLRLEARTTWLTSLLCGAGLALGVDQGMRRTLGVALPPALLGF